MLNDGPDGGIDPEEQALRSQRIAMVRSAVRRLPAKYRKVVVCRALDEMTTRETGERLRLSDEAVKTRFHRARAILKRELSKA
jgi:RNA polymerase sigma-70 factor (ECF subfamily)